MPDWRLGYIVCSCVWMWTLGSVTWFVCKRKYSLSRCPKNGDDAYLSNLPLHNSQQVRHLPLPSHQYHHAPQSTVLNSRVEEACLHSSHERSSILCLDEDACYMTAIQKPQLASLSALDLLCQAFSANMLPFHCFWRDLDRSEAKRRNANFDFRDFPYFQ